jgi:arachidonate 15-lipoxygenase
MPFCNFSDLPMPTTVPATPTPPVYPSLPQHDSAAARAARQFQLALARTSYNYMRSYLEPVPLSADLPEQEKFSIDYEAKVLQVFLPLAVNFQAAVLNLLKRELESDIPAATFEAIEKSFERVRKDLSIFHIGKEPQDLLDFLEALSKLPAAIRQVTNVPGDLLKMATGLDQAFKQFAADGPTAFLKSTLFDMLSETHGRNYLQAISEQDYRDLFVSLPTPLMLELRPQPWMNSPLLPCEQDWFFGHLQIAGFNTTNLRGVVGAPREQGSAVALAALQKKMPVTDAILQGVTGDAALTLDEAVRKNRLYVCDYALMDGATADSLHGEQRYVAAPIALFYWNPAPPPGYPPQAGGVLQPVAIQLAQQFDAVHAPIFTPNDCAGANDANGLKWRVAKYVVNVVCAIEHESIAHLGACHMTVEPIVVASHRQLAPSHPLLKLFTPHFRFTININDSALHSLIVPGGVVATNVGPDIASTLKLVADAHEAWRWDENNPDRVFALRGVDKLPAFPFRDDTMLLWRATRDFVRAYLGAYYQGDKDVQDDEELQGWVNELVSPLYAGFRGMEGLAKTGDAKRPVRIDSLDYLVEVVAQIIYIAGPQHAAVNYAQYPLMSYMPSVAGTIYRAMPDQATVLKSEKDLLDWYPPLDVGLYTFSFEFLLSMVQYDTFGHYDSNPRVPYFDDPRVREHVADFQDALALIEIEIRKRNKERAMPYPFQLPSQIPNSISI